MNDCTIQIERAGVFHGYNHTVTDYFFTYTCYNQELSDRQLQQVRQIQLITFPRQVDDYLGDSYAVSCYPVSGFPLKNHENKWVHRWSIKYYRPGSD